MVVKKEGKGKGSARRVPRNKKKYWRSGADVGDVEDFLSAQRFEQREGGLVEERADEDLFSIDRSAAGDVPKLTRRQQAVVNKRLLLSVQDDSETKCEDVKPLGCAKPLEQRKTVQMLRNLRTKRMKATASHCKAPSAKSSAAKEIPRDLWNDDNKEKGESKVPEHEEYYMRTRKRQLPREPKTVKHVTSLLPSVEVVPAGASYNPSLKSYKKYVSGIAEEEVEFERKEEKTKKMLELAPGETFVTEAEKVAEDQAGLFDEDVDDEQKPSVPDTDVKNLEVSKRKEAKRKTKKERRKGAIERVAKLKELKSRNSKQQERLLFSVRKLDKEISKDLDVRQQKALMRRKGKAAKRLLGTQRLGRGKFEDVERPFLLTDELPGSLRELKPQGEILGERFKSLQKRNMFPVGEKRLKSRLKKRLRVKEVEDRAHKQVTLGSRVI